MASTQRPEQTPAREWEQPHPRSRARLAGGALVVVAVLAAAAVALAGQGSEVLPVGETEPPAPQAFGRLEPMAPAPISDRADPAHAWTGQELLVWGGVSVRDSGGAQPQVELLADGAAYDPGEDRWRLLPPFPLEPRAGAAAVWASDRLVVWGGHREDREVLADGAAYLPAEDRWEVLPPAPGPGRTGASATYAGGAVYIAAGMAEVPSAPGPAQAVDDGLVLDLAEGTWRELAMPEGWRPDPWSALGAAGERVLLWQRRRGWSYEPGGGRWEPLPSLPAGARTSDASRLVTLDERRVLVTGVRPSASQQALGTVLDLDEGWTGTAGTGVMAPGPLRIGAGEGGVFALPEHPGSAGRAPLIALFWDPTLDRLLRIPAEIAVERTGYAAVWTGQELLVWGGHHDGVTLAGGTRWRLDGR